MIRYLERMESWYEKHSLRERIIIAILLSLLIYFFINFILISSLVNSMKLIEQDINNLKTQRQLWLSQIDALNKISTSPQFATWNKKMADYNTLQQRYKAIFKPATSHDWEKVIRSLLESEKGVDLIEIKNFPETPYKPNAKLTGNSNLFAKKYLITINSSYFEALNYFRHLEEAIPNILWQNLTYEVMKYPIAKIQVEFSILYEKK